MKQGINQVVSVEIGYDLTKVQKIEFTFLQNGYTRKNFTYPSTTAVKDLTKTNYVDLVWTAADTFKFKPGEIEMDTRITLKNTDMNPETEIVTITMEPTLFPRGKGE